jgi:ribosomal protein S19E (S16A)
LGAYGGVRFNQRKGGKQNMASEQQNQHNLKILRDSLADLEEAQTLSKRLSDKPIHDKIRKNMEKLAHDIKAEIKKLESK